MSSNSPNPIDLSRLSAYLFELPEELIAQKPLEPRDSSRLLVLDRARGTWEHRHFRDLPEYLDAHDLLIANNTRVMKSRLLGHRILKDAQGRETEGGKVEFFMLERRGAPAENTWEGLFHASGKYVRGFEFRVPTPDGRGLRGELVQGSAESPHGTVVARFDRDPIASGAGLVPLPKYIERPPGVEDDSQYQTVYAKEPTSSAAPTAGLHFTPQLLERVRARGARWAEVTLNVGLGTFRSVKTQDVSQHLLHEERYEVPQATVDAVMAAKRSSDRGGGDRIVAVGTTTVRTLESAWDRERAELRAGEGATSIFIRPGTHEFRAVDRLITNFHLPGSTLLMLVSAFAGHELVMAAYNEAVRERYRFFSYGDAMLII